jgi:hypothetical protein
MAFVRVGILMNCQSNLFHVADALRAPGGCPSCLNGRKQQGNQHAYNGDDHKQFNQRECASNAIHETILLFQ